MAVVDDGGGIFVAEADFNHVDMDIIAEGLI